MENKYLDYYSNCNMHLVKLLNYIDVDKIYILFTLCANNSIWNNINI